MYGFEYSHKLRIVKKSHPHFLLINPWIHDFAAYDFWAKPLGLLQLASILRDHGAHISYIDCLDRFHPHFQSVTQTQRQGRGAYHKTRIPIPPGLEDVPRQFSRYGIPQSWFQEDLSNLSRPDVVMLTSLMTYWYPGVQETIQYVRKAFPDVKVVLGGDLCHALPGARCEPQWCRCCDIGFGNGHRSQGVVAFNRHGPGPKL